MATASHRFSRSRIPPLTTVANWVTPAATIAPILCICLVLLHCLRVDAQFDFNMQSKTSRAIGSPPPSSESTSIPGGQSTADRADSANSVGGNFDKYLDVMLGNLGKMLKQRGYDPLHMGQLLICNNCTLEGLSLIRRTGSAHLLYHNHTVTVDAHVGFPVLFAQCMCSQRLLLVTFSGQLEVSLWNLNLYLKFSQHTQRGAHPDLQEYRVTNDGELDVNLSGRGLLAPVTEIAFRLLFQRDVAGLIRHFIYERVPVFIKERLQQFSFPIGR